MAGILGKLLEEAEPTEEETYKGAPQDTVDAVQDVISKNPAMAGIIKAVVKAIADEMSDRED